MKSLQGKRRLLIVDGDRESRDVLRSTFRSEYDVVEALDGEMALELLQKDQSFAAVVLKSRLFEISGFDVLVFLSANRFLSSIPVIMIGDREDELKALSMGAADFIREPYDAQKLYYRLKNLLLLLHTENDYDTVTGLFSYRRFLTETTRMLLLHPNENYVMVYTNIKRFKVLNALYGRGMGDEVLRRLAEEMTKLDEYGVYARSGWDHFAFCCRRELAKTEIMLRRADAMMRQLKLKYNMRICFGIYEIEDNLMPVENICDRAQMALSSIEEDSAQSFAYYDDALRCSLLEEQEITASMQKALENGQFQIYLQPIYSLSTEKPVSAEALVRWIHPEKGIIPPDRFIPLFEHNGFISKLDSCVWELVFQYLADLKKRGYPEFPVSANMSRINLYKTDLCDQMVALSEKYGVDPSVFRIEITESAYMDNPDQLLEIIRKFNAAGFSVLMDDFGSGYSSLSMLRDIPVSALKIDMGFVRDVGLSERSNSVVNSIIRMAKWLEMTIVAEGVETQAQLDYLRSIGCDRVQGYYFSRPLPIGQFNDLLFTSGLAKVEEPARVFDPVDFNGIWGTIVGHDCAMGNIMGAMGFYEFFNDSLEIICVNDEYYRLMETTPNRILLETEDALAWVYKENRRSARAAFYRARETNERQELILNRFITHNRAKRLLVTICYVGRKDDRYFYTAGFRDVPALEELELSAVQDRQDRPAAVCPPRGRETGRQRVLIVEDNHVNRMMLKKILCDYYEVLEAANGSEALSVLAELPDISAILLDLMMPVMGGYEFLAEKQRDVQLQKIPVLVLSQAETRGDEQQALRLGASDFVRKPYEPEEIKRRLAALLAADK